MIRKIVRKTLLKSKLLLLMVIVLMTLSMALLTMAQITYGDMGKSFETYKIDSQVEDFRFPIIQQISPAYDQEFEQALMEDFDLELEEKEYTTLKENDITYAVNRYKTSDKINQLLLEDGELPKAANEIVVTPGYAQRQDKAIGDVLTLNNQNYQITGLAYAIDYTFPGDLQTGNFAMGTDSFVPIYMYEESYNELTPKSTSYYSAKFNEENLNKKDLYEQIEDKYFYEVVQFDQHGNIQIDSSGKPLMQEINMIPFVLDVEDNPNIGIFSTEIESQKTVMTTLSIVIVLIAVLITIILFNNIFTSQKREMGILKAEGVSTNKLSLNFAYVLVLMIIVANILGFLLGNIFKNSMVDLMLESFSFPYEGLSQYYFWQGVMALFLLDVVILILVYLISIYKNLKKEPLLLIKNISTDRKPKFNLTKKIKNISFKTRYQINILVRNIGLTLLLSFGVFISSFLLLFAGIQYTTFNNLINNTYTQTFQYDYEVKYSVGKMDQSFDENSTIQTNVDIIDISNQDIVIDDDNKTVNLYAYNFLENDYINLEDKEKKKAEGLNPGSIYISSLIAQKYELGAGDQITIQNPYNMEEEITLEIASIVADPIYKSIYLDINQAQKLLGVADDYANSEVQKTINEDELRAYDSDIVINKSIDLAENLEASLDVVLTIILIIVVISSIIGVITLVIISSIIIQKNKKTISIMKIMGYENKEISKMTISTYKWIVIFIYFLSVPLLKLMIQTLINQSIKDLEITVDITIDYQAILLGFIVIMIIYLIAITIAKRNINKIDLATSLKIDE